MIQQKGHTMLKPLLTAILVLPLPAAASPVYLECTMTGMIWHVTVDAERGTVDYVIPASDVAQKPPAIFTMDKVYFKGMTINRIDLVFERPQITGGAAPDRGQCKIAEKQARRF